MSPSVLAAHKSMLTMHCRMNSTQAAALDTAAQNYQSAFATFRANVAAIMAIPGNSSTDLR